ncbi:DUF3078 domain-containing protein [Prolixibacteraceae bacterium JC049]|nr:DUF3078 domain-containing protein [Prolixibacteraceae bacterium JC049]
MKKVYLVLVLVVATIASYAQADSIKHWKFKGVNSLNFSQVSFSNWASGGENSVALNLLLNYDANYKKGTFTWNNNIILGYGLTRQGDEKTKKSDDRIDFSSKMGWQTGEHWSFSGLFTFKTQFAKGYKYPEKEYMSNLFSPAFFTLGLGMDYKPSKHFSLLMAPLSMKMTVVSDDELVENYGIDEGKNSRAEMGASVKAMFEKEVLTNVTLKSKLELFTNYLDHPEKIDMTWDVMVNMKINKYLATNFVVNMAYDDDVKTVDDGGVKGGPTIQYKQLLGVGLSYSF